MPDKREYENPAMPSHERDQHDAELNECLRAAQIDPDGSYLLIIVRPDPDDSDNKLRLDSGCQIGGASAMKRLDVAAILIRESEQRIGRAIARIVGHAMLANEREAQAFADDDADDPTDGNPDDQH